VWLCSNNQGVFFRFKKKIGGRKEILEVRKNAPKYDGNGSLSIWVLAHFLDVLYLDVYFFYFD